MIEQSTRTAVNTYAVGRIAGCSFDDLARLSTPRTGALFLAAEQAAAEVAAASERLCAYLFAAVPRAADPASRRHLVNMQREVFQKRALKEKTAQAAAGVLDEEGLQLVAAYQRALADAAAIERETAAAFEEELHAIRAAFRGLLGTEVMQDAMVLSSLKLLDSINRFYRVREELNGKDLDTELGAMKYFSRAAAKTSPFSKYTALTPVVVADLPSPLEVGRPSMAMASHVRLNSRLLFVLLNVLAHEPSIRVQLPLRLNSTLSMSGGAYRFLTNWSNVEAFQQVASHPAIAAVVEQLQAPMRWEALRNALATALDCEADDAEVLIGKVVALGLAEVDLAVSGSDPDWDLRLAALLRGIASPVAERLAGALGEMRRGTEELERAHGGDRVAIRNRIADCFFAATADLFAPAESAPRPEEAGDDEPAFEHGRLLRPGVPVQTIVYEDAVVDLRLRVRREDVETLVRSATRIIDAFAGFDPFVDHRGALESFFTARYGGAAADVPLLTLYEDFYRHLKDVEEARAPKPSAERIARNEAQLARLRGVIGARARSGDTVQVTSADLDLAALPAGPEKDLPSSHAAFTQCFVERRGGEDVLCAVLNGLSVGFGKVANRFLHLFPPAATGELCAWHERISGDTILAEAVDASYFNANLHPPLMPFEIATPGGQTSLPRARQLAVAELAVRRDASGLVLRHTASGRTVYAFDCGLQRVTTRSKLYQLLSLFSLGSQPNLFPFLGTINGARREDADGVRRWPRIVFDDRLVLQRRRWDVPAAALPLRARGESLLAFHARVDRWRRELGLPRHVFARIGVDAAAEKELKNRDDRKPQFIAFDNPLLVAVLEKMLGKVRTALELTEMLPAHEQLTSIGGKRYVTEHVFQWYRAR